MKWAIACFLLLAVFASGFVLGRQFPAHHYEMAMSTNPYFVLDATTGRVCDDRQTAGKNPLDSLLGKEKTGGAASSESPNDFFDKLRKQNPPNANGLPYCGK